MGIGSTEAMYAIFTKKILAEEVGLGAM